MPLLCSTVLLVLLIIRTPSSCRAAAVLAPATNGTLIEPFSALFSGTGSHYVSTFNFASASTPDWGSLTMDKTGFTGVVYQHQYWVGYDLMNIFAVSDDGSGELGIVYVYCQGSSVTAIYSEDYSHEMVEESASGHGCQINTNARTHVNVQFPAIVTAPSVSTHAANIVVTGSSSSANTISISRGTGYSVLSDHVRYDVIVFSTVDCTACGQGGWYELHAFLSSAANQRICFGIFYLFFTNTNSVLLDYTLCLSNLAQPDTTFNAKWSGKLNADAAEDGAQESDRDNRVYANTTRAMVHRLMADKAFSRASKN